MIQDPLKLFSRQRWLIDSRSKGLELKADNNRHQLEPEALPDSFQNKTFYSLWQRSIIISYCSSTDSKYLIFSGIDQFSNISTSILTPCVLLGESEAQLSIVWHMKGLQY